ncbi:Fe(3+) ABC transporter substrate-binding protein [Pelagibius sp. Alg239-R121]|uniref:Fe(3+) ABC transporter substrate-binding protein n=1 Tax=Pelagibius sp. Alg239-R121 TaxID=2993448 RepID=UPI0024A653D9|nr:Fe(3+) ABC transporter substrate-binding protein [Pelagibius sp. Alg239-R121]
MRTIFRSLGAGVAGLALAVTAAAAGAEEVNLYSSRHYSTDEALYENFTKATGIKVNRIEGKGDALIERIKSEGANSPADILLTVDVARLWRADQAELFQAVSSASLEKRVPENLRHPDGHWFGFSTRARLIYYDKAKISAGEITSYEDLADPKWQGKVCIRKSSNVYNQSLLGSMIAAHGEAAAEDWAKGVVANFARDPVKGDTNQLRGIGSGECEIAVANSYYFVRLLTKPKDKDKGLADKIGVVFPNQGDRGTHVNVSGAGVLKNAPNREAAIKFLEYLASDEAQKYFSDGNNEYPVVAEVAPTSALAGLGDFKSDPVNVAVFGDNQPLAQKIFDRAGWK